MPESEKRFEMGKNMQQQQHDAECGELSIKNRSKCMWGIFHNLNHYRWNSVKKRIPSKKRTSSKHAPVAGDQENKGADEIPQREDTKMENRHTEGKSMESGSTSKSMKSRLKALITDEVSKRRGRARSHRRSSSCAPTIHPDPSDVDSSHEASVTGLTLEHHNNVHTSLASLLDPPLPKICNGRVTPNHTCDLCVAMLRMNYFKQSEIGMHGAEDHTLLHNRLMYAIEPNKTASLQESKLFLKALDLLNVRKEVFLKILQDPSSSLLHQLHDQKASKQRLGLGKSMTFPSPGSKLHVKDNEACSPCVSGNHLCTTPELLDNVARNSPKRNGLKHFKNLREKLKYVIKESRKEKHRIVMDAVLDKIPCGRKMPKDPKEGSPRLSSPFGKSETQVMKRAQSFHESVERYNQLLEYCFHKETQHDNVCEKHGRGATEAPSPATPSPRTLERIYSLPDLRSYSYFRCEDSQCDTFSARTSTENNLNAGSSCRQGERKVMYTPTVSEYHTLSNASSDDENLQDGFQDVGETFDDSNGLKTEDSVAPNKNVVESSACSSFVPDLDLQDTVCTEKLSSAEGQPNESKTETSSLAESSEEAEKEATPVSGLTNILMHLHVDNKNKAQFDYVKDVLELSGFSGIEFLENWHSAELPLNTSVFDEVEGCLLAHPDCTGNEAGGSCDHLLLFDLINDVLLEMYERSFSYWPRSLTCHSSIRKMPVGYRVLEEVWANINWLLSWRHDLEQSLDDAVSKDLAKGNNWMNLQFDAECVGLELEELILDDLLDELIYDDLLF